MKSKIVQTSKKSGVFFGTIDSFLSKFKSQDSPEQRIEYFVKSQIQTSDYNNTNRRARGDHHAEVIESLCKLEGVKEDERDFAFTAKMTLSKKCTLHLFAAKGSRFTVPVYDGYTYLFRKQADNVRLFVKALKIEGSSIRNAYESFEQARKEAINKRITKIRISRLLHPNKPAGAGKQVEASITIKIDREDPKVDAFIEELREFVRIANQGDYKAYEKDHFEELKEKIKEREAKKTGGRLLVNIYKIPLTEYTNANLLVVNEETFVILVMDEKLYEGDYETRKEMYKKMRESRKMTQKQTIFFTNKTAQKKLFEMIQDVFEDELAGVFDKK